MIINEVIQIIRLQFFTISFVNNLLLQDEPSIKILAMKESGVQDNETEKAGDQSSESQNEPSVDPIEYPTKSKLVMVVVALMLSMFLVRGPSHSHYTPPQD